MFHHSNAVLCTPLAKETNHSANVYGIIFYEVTQKNNMKIQNSFWSHLASFWVCEMHFEL